MIYITLCRPMRCSLTCTIADATIPPTSWGYWSPWVRSRKSTVRYSNLKHLFLKWSSWEVFCPAVHCYALLLTVVHGPWTVLPHPHSLYSIFSVLSTQAAIVYNKGAWRLEHLPDCHHVQISWRRRAGEHILYCDGSLKGLAETTAQAETFICKQLSTAATVVIY